MSTVHVRTTNPNGEETPAAARSPKTDEAPEMTSPSGHADSPADDWQNRRSKFHSDPNKERISEAEEKDDVPAHDDEVRSMMNRSDSQTIEQREHQHHHHEHPDLEEFSVARRSKKVGQLAEAIATIIKDVPRGVHLTATEVYRRAQDAGLNVSLSTVYRTLNLLQQHGNVSTVSGEHGRRYEARDSDHDHDHLICLKCGLTIEFADDLLRGFGKAVAERKGYDHKSSRFDILGVCGECKAKDEDHKVSTAILSVENAIAMIEASLVELRNSTTALDARKIGKALESLMTALPAVRASLQELEATAVSLGGSLPQD